LKIPGGTSAGHADILARARIAGRDRLRVFEVKKDDAPDIAHALDQAVAYCAALKYLLVRFPATYFSASGFGRVRKNLVLDAVAFVPAKAEAYRYVESAADRLAKGGTQFGLCAQFFHWEVAAGGKALVIEGERRYV
jgi:hypothetical protein